MKAKLQSFFAERAPWAGVRRAIFDDTVEGGASFAHVFGSALLLLFVVEIVTGCLLALTYVPSIEDAWSSVFYVQERVTLGWLVRGMHGYAAEAMIVVVALHLGQVMFFGAYKRPRELTWWAGLALLGVLAGFVLTGARLPWDQRTFWALQVELNIAASVPVVGDSLYALVAGADTVGQATLTRLYGLHVAVLPLVMLGVIGVKVWLVRAHGRTPAEGAKKPEPMVPNQLVRDMAFGTLVVLVVLGLAIATRGMPLDAPADGGRDYPARPEWFLLFLFKLRKLFESSSELIATVVLPGIATTYLVLLPLIDRKETRRARSRVLFLAPVVLGVIGMGALTAMSVSQDAADADFQAAVQKAASHAHRARELARSGIPAAGPLAMLDDDPLTRGREVYAQYCASCHVLGGEGERKAPDHDALGSRAWVIALLRAPQSDRFFAHAELDDEMPVQTTRVGGEPGLTAVAEFLFAEGVEPQDVGTVDRALRDRGEQLFRQKCMGCHVYRGEGDDNGIGAPNLTGYASRTWISRQISAPEALTQYGELNEMPAFADQLSAHDIEMVTAFLRRQRFEAYP